MSAPAKGNETQETCQWVVRSYNGNDAFMVGLNEMDKQGYTLHSWKQFWWQDQWFANCVFEKKLVRR